MKLLDRIFLTRQLMELKVRIKGMTFLLESASSDGRIAVSREILFTRRRARSITVRG